MVKDIEKSEYFAVMAKIGPFDLLLSTEKANQQSKETGKIEEIR